ncbi:MAG: pyridoxal 5'-phosphate synthase [Thermodesulfobacteriota bacterium]
MVEKTGHEQFGIKELREVDLDKDPFKQFEKWYEEASASAGLRYPDAFALATVSPDMKPSSRMLLLKGVDEKGFVFYTNSESRKGEELSGNLNAAMCFWWEWVERQVRIEGAVEMLPKSDSDDYFSSRPRGASSGHGLRSRAGLSPTGIPRRKVPCDRRKIRELGSPAPALLERVQAGPFVDRILAGRPDRLHDRLRYTKLPSGEWLIERLAP